MHPILIRILKQGIPTALLLAAIGYLLAEAAGMWAATQDVRGPLSGGELTSSLKQRLPFTMAALGLGLIVAYEVLRGLLGVGKQTTPTTSPPDEAEKLLNQLLQQADEAEAKRKAAEIPGSTCPTPPASENNPVSN